MPLWGWSLGPGMHAWPQAWQVLLASYGCSGKRAHREVSPMFSFQSQTAKSTSWKHHGHSSPGTGPSWLSMPGTWERPGRKCSGDNRPFHQVHSGICYKNSNGTDNGKDPMGQIYCSLQSPWKDFDGSRMQLWEWVGGWPLWVDGGCKRYGPVRITHRPMVNVKGSTPLWSTCLGLYPRKRSQSGRTTLEHWSMAIIAPKIQPQGSAPTNSCLVDNLAFQLMWHLVWLHTPSQSQTLLNLSRNWENRPSGPTKKQKPSGKRGPMA